jgi:hypothetical protein
MFPCSYLYIFIVFTYLRDLRLFMKRVVSLTILRADTDTETAPHTNYTLTHLCNEHPLNMHCVAPCPLSSLGGH